MPGDIVQDTHEEAAFRARCRSWLAANMPRLEPGGMGPTDREKVDDEAKLRRVEEGRVNQAKLYEAGYSGLTAPVTYGGQGLPHRYQQIFHEEARGYDVTPPVGVGIGMVMPTLLAHASEEQKRHYIPKILSGEHLWVQFLSEPSGGSDVAGLLTKATRDGDEWVINGAKIWSSDAWLCDYALCLARTDDSLPKHAGLSAFIVPVRSPGVTVHRVRQINGDADFCQEFLDDVRVPAENVVGEVNGGWRVATTWLGAERMGMGGALGGPLTAASEMAPDPELVELARERESAGDSYIRSLIAEDWVITAVQQALVARVATAIRAGAVDANPGGAVLKLFAAVVSQRKAEIGAEMAGPFAAARPATDRRPIGYGQSILYARARSIGGGTNEMQRNVIGERHLGLPREPAVDRDVPFREVRQNRIPTRFAREQ